MRVVEITKNGQVIFDNGATHKPDKNSMWLYESDSSPWETREWFETEDGRIELKFK